MDVLVEDPLRAVLNCRQSIDDTWPEHAPQVRVLLHRLRLRRTLADVLADGLVQMATPPTPTSSEVTVMNGEATVSGQALDAAGERIPSATTRPERVVGVCVQRVGVPGRSTLGRTG